MTLQALDRRRRFARIVDAERGELAYVIGHAEMKDHRIGDTGPRNSREAARSLQAEIERDLVRGGAESHVGKLLVEVESLSTREIETFVGDDRPMTFDKGVFQTPRIMLPVSAEILSLDDLGPEDQTDGAGRVWTEILRLRRP